MIAIVSLVVMLLMGKLLPLMRSEQDRLSDESILHACGLGDMAALGILFDRMHDKVYRFLARLLGPTRPDSSDLEDLTQATFLEVHRAAGSFAGRSSASTFVLGVAANLARRHMRGEKRRRTLGVLSEERTEAPKVRPDDHAEKRQLLSRLSDAVAELPVDLRTAFVLCEVEEIPGVEAARVLGVPPGTLWRRVHEARRRLREAIA